MMKNSNGRTNLTRKAAAIASAVMTLSTVAVLTMAPMSQAQAQAKARDSKVFRHDKNGHSQNYWWKWQEYQIRTGIWGALMSAEGIGRDKAGTLRNSNQAKKCDRNYYIYWEEKDAQVTYTNVKYKGKAAFRFERYYLCVNNSVKNPRD